MKVNSINHDKKLKKIPLEKKARTYLSKLDPKLNKLIQEVGPVTIEINEKESVYEALGVSIIYQQLHAKAASSILNRLKELFGGKKKIFPSMKTILMTPLSELQKAGLSQAKALALKDLALKSQNKIIPNRKKAETLSDEELLERLTLVKGIGPWTVHMFLIFTLGRPNVLASGDYGVRTGFAKLYKKKELPTPKEFEKLTSRWSPYSSFACWYMWRVLDLEKQSQA